MAGVVSFRFPHETVFEQLPGLDSPVTVGALRTRVLERRPAAAEALHGSRNLAASGWRMLLTDASTKTGARLPVSPRGAAAAAIAAWRAWRLTTCVPSLSLLLVARRG